MVEVAWQPTGKKVCVDPRKLLLFSLLEQGIHVDYQCLEGHCKACELILLEGEVAYDSWNADRLLDCGHGKILACACRPVISGNRSLKLGLNGCK